MEATTPAYPTRLSNTQWATLAAYFAADSQLGRPRTPTCQPWSRPFCMSCVLAAPGACCRGTFRRGTLYGYFRPWRDNGTWQRIHRYLRALGKAPVQAPPVAQCGHRRYAVGAAGRCLSRKLSHRLMHSVTLELVPFQSDSA